MLKDKKSTKSETRAKESEWRMTRMEEIAVFWKKMLHTKEIKERNEEWSWQVNEVDK
jgi:hypothetical protein